MNAIVELLSTGWFALGIFKVFALTILGAAFIACVRQRDLTSSLWMGLLLSLPLAFFSGLLPLSWKALPHVPKAVAETFLKPAAHALPLPAPQSTTGAEDDLLLEPGHVIVENVASSVPMAIMKPSSPSLSSGEWLLCLWISGGVITLLPAILSSLASRRLRRSPATPEMSSLWAGLAGDTADFVPLRISCDIEAPGVTSALRPEVILPVSALDWEKSQLASVLHHELHHIARHDLLFRSLGLLARALLWFHPAAWWIQSRLVLAQEQAADEAVLASGIPAADYATHLLDVAVSARTFPGIAMARRSQLGGRIRLLLAKRSSLSAMRKRAEFLFAAAMALVAVAVLPLGFAAGDSARAADEPITADHGDRPPILDRNGAVIATSDPARMPDSLRGIPPVRWYPGGEMLAPVSGYIFRDIHGGTVVGKGTGLEDSEFLADGRVLHSSIDIRIQRLAWAALQKRELRDGSA
jgi:beta-lactamase regulating signal transducer with metallopeptidase domain